MPKPRYGEHTVPDAPLETAMTEELWIELIRIAPTFMWLGFAVIALVVVRGILTSEAHRMTRVETPFVSVELAREAIELANHPRTEHPDTVPEALPPPCTPPLGGPVDGASEEPDHAGPPVGEQRSPQGRTPESDEGAYDGRRLAQGTAAPGSQERPLEETPPRSPRPPIPSQPLPVPSPPYPPAADPVSHSPQALTEAPYRLGPAQPMAADSQRGIGAATRLALSTDLLQGGAILWVDDHHEWNESLVRLFRTAGIKVDTVDSTDAALHAMMAEHYDLVVTDMRRDNEPSGGAAGMALLDRMVGAGVPTPAIFFSGHPKADAAVHPRAVTATSSPEALVNYVIDLVGHRRRRQDEGKPLRFPWRQR